MTYLWQVTPSDGRRHNEVVITRQEIILRSRRTDTERATGNLPELLTEAGVPQQLDEMRFTMFDGMPRFAEAQDFIKGILGGEGIDHMDHSGLGLFGVPSAGKTAFAVAVLRSAAWNGYSVKFIDWEAFGKFHTSWIEMSQNAARYDDYAERADAWREEQWRMLQVYDFLVLDDIFRSKAPDLVTDELHTLVRQRTAAGKFTILTANRSLADLRGINDSFVEFLDREYIIIGFGTGTELAGTRAR